MVHKMQRMALSSHQLVAPAASAAEKADSENTRNSDNNGDPEEEAQQGDWITHQHNWTKLNRKQDWETHATHTNTETDTRKDGQAQTQEEGERHIVHAFTWIYYRVDDDGTCPAHSQMQMHLSIHVDKKRHSLVQVLWLRDFLPHRLKWFFSASIQRDSSQPTDEAAGSEQQ